MNPMSAALVLAWAAIILLLFALAGLKVQMRDLRVAVVGMAPQQRSTAVVGGPDPLANLLTAGSASLTVVLMTDKDCPICHEVAPRFADLAMELAGVDALILSAQASSEYEQLPVRVVVDHQAFDALDPGYRPAILVLDEDRKVVVREPAGAQAAVDGVMAKVRQHSSL